MYRTSSSSASTPLPGLLASLGYHARLARALAALSRPDLVPARVVAHFGERLQLAGTSSGYGTPSGRLLHHVAPIDQPVVGDWVAVTDGTWTDQPAIIHHVLPRTSAMIRRAAGRRGVSQVVAANVDTFLIVTSANRDANPRRVERYLAAVWDSGARPVIVVNKVDLCPPTQLAAIVEALTSCAPYVPVRAVSAATGDGFDAMLASAMATANPAESAAQTLAFIGMSGVGKSSLVNRLLGVDRQLTLPIDQEDRGRHGATCSSYRAVRSSSTLRACDCSGSSMMMVD